MSHPEALGLPLQEGRFHPAHLGRSWSRWRGRSLGLDLGRGLDRGLSRRWRDLKLDVAFIMGNDLSDHHHSANPGDRGGRHGGQRGFWEAQSRGGDANLS